MSESQEVHYEIEYKCGHKWVTYMNTGEFTLSHVATFPTLKSAKEEEFADGTELRYIRVLTYRKVLK